MRAKTFLNALPAAYLKATANKILEIIKKIYNYYIANENYPTII